MWLRVILAILSFWSIATATGVYAQTPPKARPAHAVSQPIAATAKAVPNPEHRAKWWNLAAQKDAIASLQSLVTIAAILLGGIWGYFKLIAGRIYTSRLETSVAGELRSQGPCPHVAIRILVKNVGLTRVYLDKSLSSVEVKAFTDEDYVPVFHTPDLTHLGVVPALSSHEWIEPGECVTEDKLLALPPKNILSVTLRFRLLENPTRFKKRQRCIEWNAVAVLVPQVIKAETESKNANSDRKGSGGDPATTATAATTTAAAKAG